MRENDKMIFLGNGEHSAKQTKKLRKRLKWALMMLGGLQQGVPTSDPGWREVEDVAADIFIALTGKEPLSI
jgi:hypothetical protein